MGQRLDQRITRGLLAHGDKFDTSTLANMPPDILQAFETQARVRVQGPTGTRTGVVSTTTGWRPAFILMHRSSDMGSADVLGPEDRVIAVKRGNRYVEI